MLGVMFRILNSNEKMKKQKVRSPRFFRWILANLTVYEELFAISRDFDIEYIENEYIIFKRKGWREKNPTNNGATRTNYKVRFRELNVK